jgi:predicted RNase H-like HicB family nuclease
MLTYKAAFVEIPEGFHAEVVDYPGVITFGKDLTEARRMLASTLVDRAETKLLLGEVLPIPVQAYESMLSRKFREP